jgi:predicted secreted protein
MAAFAGRQITFRWGDESPQDTIEGVREKGVELNGEPIDITSDDDAGWRRLLTIPAENQVNLKISGVTKSARLKRDWLNGDRYAQATITWPDGGRLTGDFFLSTYNETGAYNGATTFEASLMSSGVVTYSPVGSPL